MSEKKDVSMKRRKALKTVGVLGGAVAFPGATAAGRSSGDVDLDSVDTSDWYVDLTPVTQEGEVRSDVETQVFVGEERTASASDVEIEPDDVGGTWTLVKFTLPSEVPNIGGATAELKATAEVGISGATVGLSLCVDGDCIQLGSFSLGMFQGTLLDIEVKGTVEEIPLTVDGELDASLGRDGWTPQLELDASLELCVGRENCDGDESGWDEELCDEICDGSDSLPCRLCGENGINCRLCYSRSGSVSVP